MKNNLKKRILSFALATVMMASMMPLAALTAFAEETSGGNIEITQQNTVPSPSPSAEPDNEANTPTPSPSAEPDDEANTPTPSPSAEPDDYDANTPTPSPSAVPSASPDASLQQGADAAPAPSDVPTAEQQTQAAAVAAIDLEDDTVQQTAKLKSLVIYKSNANGQEVPNNLIVRGETTGKKGLVFSPDKTVYNLSADDGSNFNNIYDWSVTATLHFEAIPEDGCKAILRYGDTKEDITTTSGNFKIIRFLKAGVNTFYIDVEGEGKTPTTYTFTANVNPSLVDGAISADESVHKNGSNYIEPNIVQSSTKPAKIYVSSELETLTVNVKPSDEKCIVKYAVGNRNGEYTSNNVIDVKNNIKNGTLTVYIKAELKVSDELTLLSNIYSLQIIQATPKKIFINPNPADATIELIRNDGEIITQNDDGSFDVIFYRTTGKTPTDLITYTYKVSREDYVEYTGESIGLFSEDSKTFDVTLTKEIPTQPKEISDVAWKNFRNSDVNMAITPFKTPTDKIALKWNKTLGTGWGSSPSVPIIVDNKIVVMSGKKLYMLDAESGEIVKEADMVSAPNFGYTPPTYANGMIFCPLSNGTVQAFNATTLESLWVYRDSLGGQALSPIAYSTIEVDDRPCGYIGYIYTGFWNGESGDANYVCIDVTDYDADKEFESKKAEWSHEQKGGFYWAGAVVVGDAVIVGTDDGGAEGTDAGSYLYSFNKKTGEVITELALASDAGDQRSSIAYDTENGKIYFTTKGGYLYSAKVNSDCTVTGLKGVNYDAQLTSTPVVYKGKVYFGIGSGIRTDGSEGSFVVADADTLKEIASVELKGYPQGSALLSKAYEADGYLYFYMTYNDKPGGISMLKVKNDAQSAADIQLTEIYDAAGFEEFCIASIICGDDGTLYYKNDSGNFFAVAPATYKTVIELIDKIGTVTLESESVIKAAREAYEELEESEKAKVTNLDVLIAAEKELENFVEADKVDKLISDIGYVTLNNGKRIKEAREAYDKLTDYQKTLVKNYDKLLELEKEYDKLADEAVSKVEKLIDKIGEVDIDSADDIAAAKLAYNQLPDELKELVKNYYKLEKAEKELKKLREESLALLAEGKLVLTKTELLELKEDFEKVTENTSYDAVLALLRTFYKLGEKQQLALENSDEVKLAQKIVAKHNHNNDYTGVKVDGLEWNIRLVVEETDNETVLNGIKEKLENNDILTIWDIYLEDVLTGKEYNPEEAVELKIPTNLMGDYTAYDYLKVIHYTDDGRIELLNCEVEDGYVVFNAAEFSWYGVVGFMNETEETIGENLTLDAPVTVTPQVDIPQNNSSPVLWVVIAAVGVAALAVLAVMKKRTKYEE